MFEFRPARREKVHLLLGVSGASGSGKTWSAMALAKGLAGGARFAVIDTENRRASMYADYFDFDACDLTAPFSPDRYMDAIQSADKAGYPVILVDSMSHEWAGDGGCLDMQDAELERMAGSDWKKREACKMSAWIRPKLSHKAMMSKLLQVNAHVILAFRAESKVEMARNAETGKMEIREKKTLTSIEGWIPISEKSLPFELTASFLLMPDRPGLPRPIKLQEQHKKFFPLDKPISEESGRQMAEWARGGVATTKEPEPGDDEFERDLQVICMDLGVKYLDVLAQLAKQNYAKPSDVPADKRQAVIDWIKKKAA